MENGRVEIFDPNNASGGELEPKTLIERGVSRNFNDSFI